MRSFVFFILLFPSFSFGLSDSISDKLDLSTMKVVDRKHDLIGTAFAISSNGYLITNYHVTKGEEEYAIEKPDGTIVPCQTIEKNKKRDLVLLKIDEEGLKDYFPSDTGAKLIKGERVNTCGFPQDGGKPIRSGYVESFRGKYERLTPGLRYIQCHLKLTPGMSGSAVVNEEGELVGIHNHKDNRGHSFAIPVKYLNEMLKRQNLFYSDSGLLIVR